MSYIIHEFYLQPVWMCTVYIQVCANLETYETYRLLNWLRLMLLLKTAAISVAILVTPTSTSRQQEISKLCRHPPAGQVRPWLICTAPRRLRLRRLNRKAPIQKKRHVTCKRYFLVGFGPLKSWLCFRVWLYPGEQTSNFLKGPLTCTPQVLPVNSRAPWSSWFSACGVV